MIPYVELKTQYQSIESEIRAALDAVFERSWFVLGEEGAAFEHEFAAYIGVNHAVGVASGTEAIQLALTALGVQYGDEVVTAANTCAPTACGIVASGARLVLADVDPHTLTMAPESLEQVITPLTRAIVPVHLYGHPCDMDPILEIARAHRIKVVEDCAQCHGAEYKGRKCGAQGDAAAFSFYPSKNLGAYGDGGAVAVNYSDTDSDLRKLRNYGEEKRYHHTTAGINSRLDEIQAAILRVKLKRLDAWNNARRERARLYDAALAAANVQRPSEADWAHHVYHLYVIRTQQRDALQAHLKESGVGTFIHYPIPLHAQPAFEHLGYKRGDFPEAERACDSVLSLPMYPELPLEAVNQVAEAIASFRG